MFEKEKREILDVALETRKCNLTSPSGGNVNMRAGENLFLMTSSGMTYEGTTTDDMVVIDWECKVVEGMKKSFSDSSTLAYMLEHTPHTNALIHTHQPYATAAGFAADQIPESLVTLIDTNGAAANVAPFMPSSDIGVGIMAMKYAGESRAVILKHHGIMAHGADMKEALCLAIYLEEAVKTFVLTKAMGVDIPLLAPEDVAKRKRGWLDYGQ